ncbi:MAG: hypothetical protein KBC98_01145 [Candidatus Pacebacteria bacterium]|nr:hypothetical protein [Candidatus Paceibacterota bacterium]
MKKVNSFDAWPWITKNPDAATLFLGILSGLLIGFNLMNYQNPWNLSGWILGIITLISVLGTGCTGIAQSFISKKPWSPIPAIHIWLICMTFFCMGEIIILGLFFHHADISPLLLWWTHIQHLWKPLAGECIILGVLGTGILLRIWAEQNLGNLD